MQGQGSCLHKQSGKQIHSSKPTGDGIQISQPHVSSQTEIITSLALLSSLLYALSYITPFSTHVPRSRLLVSLTS